MSSMRMNKSGSQTITSTSATQVTSWTADGGYPSTVISSSRLVINATGRYRLSAQVNRGASTSVTPLSIYVNGSAVSTGSGSASFGVKIVPSVDVDLSPGDTVDLRVRKFLSSDDSFVVNAANTRVIAEQLNADWTAGASTATVVDRTSSAALEASTSTSQTITTTPTATAVRTTYGGATLTIGLTSTAELEQLPGAASMVEWNVTPVSGMQLNQAASADLPVVVTAESSVSGNLGVGANLPIVVTRTSGMSWKASAGASRSVSVASVSEAEATNGSPTNLIVPVLSVSSLGIVHGGSSGRAVAVVSVSEVVVRAIPTGERTMMVGREDRRVRVVPDSGPVRVVSGSRFWRLGGSLNGGRRVTSL